MNTTFMGLHIAQNQVSKLGPKASNAVQEAAPELETYAKDMELLVTKEGHYNQLLIAGYGKNFSSNFYGARCVDNNPKSIVGAAAEIHSKRNTSKY